MPQIIEVPGLAEYEFPDGMSDDEIRRAIHADVANQASAGLSDVLKQSGRAIDAAGVISQTWEPPIPPQPREVLPLSELPEFQQRMAEVPEYTPEQQEMYNRMQKRSFEKMFPPEKLPPIAIGGEFLNKLGIVGTETASYASAGVNSAVSAGYRTLGDMVYNIAKNLPTIGTGELKAKRQKQAEDLKKAIHSLSDEYGKTAEEMYQRSEELSSYEKSTAGPEWMGDLVRPIIGVVPYIAAGEAAPILIGAQVFGDTYQRVKQLYQQENPQADPEEVHREAAVPAFASGVTSALIWELGGKVGKKLVVGKDLTKAGAETITKTIGRQAAHIGVTASTAATDVLSQEIIDKAIVEPDKPVSQIVADAFSAGKSMALLSAVLAAPGMARFAGAKAREKYFPPEQPGIPGWMLEAGGLMPPGAEPPIFGPPPASAEQIAQAVRSSRVSRKPTVPGTPAEEYATAIQTVRNAGAREIRQIQALFPNAGLSREQARNLRNLAFPELAPQPGEKHASEITSTTGVPEREIRSPMGETPPLRPEGEITTTPPPVAPRPSAPTGQKGNAPKVTIATGKPNGTKAEVIDDFIEAEDLAKLAEKNVTSSQTRQREGNLASEQQIMQIATSPDLSLLGRSNTSMSGAPIVDVNVEAGNGRSFGIIEGYRRGTEGITKSYQAQVRALAKELGRDDVAGMKHPVHIRRVVRYLNGDRESFVVESNPKYAALQETATEQGLLDADALGNLHGYPITEAGDLTQDAVRMASMRLDQANRGSKKDSTGRPDEAELNQRFRIAVLAKMAKENNFSAKQLTQLIESDAGKKVLSEVIRSLPLTRGLDADLSLGGSLLNALSELQTGIKTSKALQEWYDNLDSELIKPNISPAEKIILGAMVQGNKTPTFLREFLKNYYENAQREQALRNEDRGAGQLFGEPRRPITGEEILTGKPSVAPAPRGPGQNELPVQRPKKQEVVSEYKPVPKGTKVSFLYVDGTIRTGTVDVPASEPGGLVRVMMDTKWEDVKNPTNIAESNLKILEEPKPAEEPKPPEAPKPPEEPKRPEEPKPPEEPPKRIDDDIDIPHEQEVINDLSRPPNTYKHRTGWSVKLVSLPYEKPKNVADYPGNLLEGLAQQNYIPFKYEGREEAIRQLEELKKKGKLYEDGIGNFTWVITDPSGKEITTPVVMWNKDQAIESAAALFRVAIHKSKLPPAAPPAPEVEKPRYWGRTTEFESKEQAEADEISFRRKYPTGYQTKVSKRGAVWDMKYVLDLPEDVLSKFGAKDSWDFLRKYQAAEREVRDAKNKKLRQEAQARLDPMTAAFEDAATRISQPEKPVPQPEKPVPQPEKPVPQPEKPVPQPEEDHLANLIESEFGIPVSEWREMANYNDYDQMARYGTTRARLLEALSLTNVNKDLQRDLAKEQKKLDANLKKVGSMVPPPIVSEITRKIGDRMAKIQDRIDANEKRIAQLLKSEPPVEQKPPVVEQKPPPVEQKPPVVEQKPPPVEQKPVTPPAKPQIITDSEADTLRKKIAERLKRKVPPTGEEPPVEKPPIESSDDAAYMAAVESGNKEEAQRMVNEAAQASGLPILDDSASEAYRVRRTPPPKKTKTAYKLFITRPYKPGEVYTLFVGADEPLPKGVWLDAIEGAEHPPTPTGRKQVKSKLGALAYRPGWHSGDLPVANHIGVKNAEGKVFARRPNEVWAEVEISADKDWQPEANANGINPETGKINPSRADLKHVPTDGYYRYKTNPQMQGDWMISGSLKIKRILSEAEVSDILKKNNVEPMPWRGGNLNLAELGLTTDPARNQYKLLDAVTYDDNGDVIPLSQRFNPASEDIRYSAEPEEFFGAAEEAPKPKKSKLDPETYNQAVMLGAYEIQSGSHTFPAFAEKMREYFGNELDDHLRSIYETARISIESPIGESSAGKSPGLQPGLRPPEDRIVTAREDFTRKADESVIPPALVQHLDTHQRQGAATGIASLSSVGGGLNADGTGAGKTRQSLAIAKYFADQGNAVIIVTRAETLGKPDWKKEKYGGSYFDDAKAMGIDLPLIREGNAKPGRIGITTYENLDGVVKNTGPNTVLIFDEAHALKNPSIRGRRGLKAIGKAKAVMFFTATPADKPEHIHYLARIGILENEDAPAHYRLERQLKKLGMKLVEREVIAEDDFGNRSKKTVHFWAKDMNVSDAEREQRFNALFERMTDKGVMIKREISMQGTHVQVLRLSLPPEGHQLQSDILQKALEVYKKGNYDELSGLQRAIVLGHQRRQQEPFKIASAVMLARRELQQGRQVVIFVSRVRESEVGFNETVINPFTGEREKVRHVLMSSEGTAKSLRSALHEAGIHDIAEIHGDSDQTSLDAMADFQSGKKRVVIATMESGGTGINLDDRLGNRPRTMIVVTAPFSAVDNVQAAGRIWRLKTLSGSNYFYLFGDTKIDDWNASIIGTKMKTLGAVVEGQVKNLDVTDPDRVDISDWSEEHGPGVQRKTQVGFPKLEWNEIKTRLGRTLWQAKVQGVKPFWKWWEQNLGMNNPFGLRISKPGGEWHVTGPRAIPEGEMPPAAEGEVKGPPPEAGMEEIRPEEMSAEEMASATGAPTPAPATPATPGPVTLPPQSQREIIASLSRALEIPIRFGRMAGRKYAGFFAKLPHLIVSKRANDMAIASHEIGHAIDSKFGIRKDPTLEAELLKLGDPAAFPGSRSSWTPSRGKDYKKGEGFAEFIRYWMQNPAFAKANAPNIHAFWEGILNANKDIGDKLRTAQQNYQVWLKSDLRAQLQSHISIGDNPNKTPYTLDQLTRDVVDDLHFLRMASEEAAFNRKRELPPSQDPYLLARLLRGSYGMAATFIRDGIVSYKTKKVDLGTGLEDILKPLAGRLTDFSTYIVAKRAKELHSQGRETGLTNDQINKTLDDFKNDKDFEDAFEKLKEWQDALLQYAVDAGALTASQAARWRNMNEDYVPFHRLFEVGAGEFPSVSSAGIGRGLNVARPGSFKKLTGSPRSIVNPLETIIKNAYVLITNAEKSAIQRAVAKLATEPGMGKWVQKVSPPKERIEFELDRIKKQLIDAGADLTDVDPETLLAFYRIARQAPYGENIIRIVEGNKANFYRLDRDLYDTFNALDLDDSGRMVRMLAAPAQMLRSGVVLEPTFALSNLMRDAVSSAVINKYGLFPFEASVRGIAAMIRRPDIVAEWAAAGGQNSIEASYFDRKKLQKFLAEKVAHDFTPAERAKIVLTSPLIALRWLTTKAEEATRIGEYQVAYEHLRRGGMAEGDARRLAAFESRDRQDFAKGGAKTKIVRHLAAFWNAQLQANVKLYQKLKGPERWRTMIQGFVYVTMAKLMEQAVNWNDDDYWDRPQWERDLFFLIPSGKDKSGHTSFIRIPTPFEVGLIFGTLPGRMLQWYKNNDPKAKDFADQMLDQSVPNPLPNFVRLLLEPIAGGERGWDFWRSRQIVPERLLDLPAGERYTAQTSEGAKKVGKMVGVAPIKVEHMLEQAFGGLGRLVTRPGRFGSRFKTTPLNITSQVFDEFYTLVKKQTEFEALRKRENPEAATTAAGRYLNQQQDRIADYRDKARKAEAAGDEKTQNEYLEAAFQVAKEAVKQYKANVQ